MFKEKKFIEKLIESLKKKCQSDNTIDINRALGEISSMSHLPDMLEKFCTLILSGKKGEKNEVNSYLAYVFGITSKKPDGPFRPKMNFELARVSHPDIDIDFDFFHRDETYQYLIERYGREYTSNIGTYQRFKAKNALRKTIKAIDPFDDKDKSLEFENYAADLVSGVPGVTLDTAVKENMELEKLSNKYPEIFEIAQIIEGLSCAPSRHAAGLVISDVQIQEVAPLHRLKDGSYATQFEMAELEDLGLIKFDILALKTLSYFNMIENDLRNELDIEFDVEKIPLDDQKSLKLIAKGLTDSVFQLEGRGMKELLQNMQVNVFNDVAASNALYRPGAMAADAHTKYCDCKHGRSKVVYDHPKLKKILDDTYGQLIYQEQCQLAVMELAGFNRREADKLRKAIGKKQGDLFIALKKKFIEGAAEHSGMNENAASQFFKKIEDMGGYAFCKCLDGSTKVIDKITGKEFSLEELSGYNSQKDDYKLIFDSYLDGEIVEDEVVEIFKVGQMEVFEIELEDGSIIKCTLDHKFYCSDGKPHTVKEIIENDLSIIANENTDMQNEQIQIQ